MPLVSTAAADLGVIKIMDNFHTSLPVTGTGCEEQSEDSAASSICCWSPSDAMKLVEELSGQTEDQLQTALLSYIIHHLSEKVCHSKKV
jgi:hypothetical protein